MFILQKMQKLKCGTSLCNKCKLAGQFPFQTVSVVSVLDHLSLHLPQLKFWCVHNVLQRRCAVGTKTDQAQSITIMKIITHRTLTYINFNVLKGSDYTFHTLMLHTYLEAQSLR